MLSQQQFPGMESPRELSHVGEKSRPAPRAKEPSGSVVRGEDEDGYHIPGTGDWRSHEEAGAGIRTITPGGYSPEVHMAGGFVENPVTREIPIQNARGPVVWSHQADGVSMDRVRQIERAPETAGTNERPSVVTNPMGEVAVYDGNHRMTAALRRNEMFQPVDLYSAST